MATSHFHQIPGLGRYIEMLQPSSILDIGAGIGKWGFLCRDQLEFLQGRPDKDSWVTRIYGIEIYEGYRNPLWDYCYDDFWVGNVVDVLEEAPDVDLILLADILEHMPKEKGQKLLTRLEEKGCYLLISTPAYFFKGEHDNNPASEHISFWGPKDFSGKWIVTEKYGDTNFFFIDLSKSSGKPLVVENAERQAFGSLLRAAVFKVLHKRKLPSGRCVAPATVRKSISNNHGLGGKIKTDDQEIKVCVRHTVEKPQEGSQ